MTNSSGTPNKFLGWEYRRARQNGTRDRRAHYEKENEERKSQIQGPITRSSSVSLRLLVAVKHPNLVCFISSSKPMLISLSFCCRRYNNCSNPTRVSDMAQPTSRHLWNNSRRLQEESRRLREATQKKLNRPKPILELSKSATDSGRRRRRPSAP